jgi:hypothetical protein
MRRDETLQEYTNCYFEHRNTLAGIKDEDIITYYKKETTNIKLFEKIHEADAHTITDLMAYVDKLVDTQDAVMHDFNGEDHDDRGNRSRKRSGKAYMIDPSRPSTFLEGDFNMVMDDQCQFHCDAKHTMRECEQLKHALGIPSDSKKNKSSNNNDQNIDQHFDIRNRQPDRRDYCDRRPYRRNDEGIDVIITVSTSAVTTETIGVTTDVARTTTTAMTTTARSGLHHHHLKGATPMVRSSQPTERSTSLLAVTKRPKATDSSDQTQGRLSMSTLKLHRILYVLGDIMVSYNCESATVELSKDSVVKAAAMVMVAQEAKIDQTTLEVPEQKRTSTALDPSPAVKKVCLGLPDASKKSSSGPTLTPNRNSSSLVSSGTTLTSSHGARLTCPVSPWSWLSTHLK